MEYISHLFKHFNTARVAAITLPSDDRSFVDTQMLKLACDAFSKDYFSEHYRALEDADYATISNEDYLKELQLLDIEVGKKNNLGEIKSFVLLQVLSVMLGEQIYVFCSDDKNARN